MAKPISDANDPEPPALPFRTGGRLARQYEYLVAYFFAIASWCLEICAAVLGSLYGGHHRAFVATIAPFFATHWAALLQTIWMMATANRSTIAERMAYLNLACRLQRLMAPTALIGMVSWAVAYRFREKASSQAYWIIFLVVWIMNTVGCIMNVYNNITWESDLLYQIAPSYPQGNFWLAALGIRSMCRAKHKHHEKEAAYELDQQPPQVSRTAPDNSYQETPNYEVDHQPSQVDRTQPEIPYEEASNYELDQQSSRVDRTISNDPFYTPREE